MLIFSPLERRWPALIITVGVIIFFVSTVTFLATQQRHEKIMSIQQNSQTVTGTVTYVDVLTSHNRRLNTTTLKYRPTVEYLAGNIVYSIDFKPVKDESFYQLGDEQDVTYSVTEPTNAVSAQEMEDHTKNYFLAMSLGVAGYVIAPTLIGFSIVRLVRRRRAA